VGTGPREAWGRSRTRRGLRRDGKWRRERCRRGGSVRNSDGAIAIRAGCRETDLSQRRGEVLTTRPTFKPKFHKCFDNIMPASFGVRQSETAGIYKVNEDGTIKPVYVNNNGQLGTQPPASFRRFKKRLSRWIRLVKPFSDLNQ